MGTSANSFELAGPLPPYLKIDDKSWLRQVERTDVFIPFDGLTVRYITCAALATRRPGQPAVKTLQEYCFGRLKGRYMLVSDEQQAGYLGISKGTEPGVAGIAYYVSPYARRKGLATAALTAVTRLELDGISEWELTIADRNTASIGVAEKCGFVATDMLILDEVLSQKERVYRKPTGIQ